MKDDMSKIFEWSNLSWLTINFSKTRIMHFGSKAKTLTHACDVGGFIIEGVHTYRYLGLYLDQDLTFKADLKETIRIICLLIILEISDCVGQCRIYIVCSLDGTIYII